MGKRYSREELEERLGSLGRSFLWTIESELRFRGAAAGWHSLEVDWMRPRLPIKVKLDDLGRIREVETPET